MLFKELRSETQTKIEWIYFQFNNHSYYIYNQQRKFNEISKILSKTFVIF
jgi:hypothetical protein